MSPAVLALGQVEDITCAWVENTKLGVRGKQNKTVAVQWAVREPGVPVEVHCVHRARIALASLHLPMVEGDKVVGKSLSSVMSQKVCGAIRKDGSHSFLGRRISQTSSSGITTRRTLLSYVLKKFLSSESELFQSRLFLFLAAIKSMA